MFLQNQAGVNFNVLALMAAAGALAAFGMAIGAVELVIAAMIIAPGFETISRVSLGLVARGIEWRSGLTATLCGYLALAGSALITGLVIRAADWVPLPSGSAYHSADVLIEYWTTLSVTSLLAFTTAAI